MTFTNIRVLAALAGAFYLIINCVALFSYLYVPVK